MERVASRHYTPTEAAWHDLSEVVVQSSLFMHSPQCRECSISIWWQLELGRDSCLQFNPPCKQCRPLGSETQKRWPWLYQWIFWWWTSTPTTKVGFEFEKEERFIRALFSTFSCQVVIFFFLKCFFITPLSGLCNMSQLRAIPSVDTYT